VEALGGGKRRSCVRSAAMPAALRRARALPCAVELRLIAGHDTMDKQSPPTSFGVFKPVGHVLIQFANLRDLEAAAEAIQRLGVPLDGLAMYTPRQMLEQIDKEMQAASRFAAMGQEINLSKAHRTAAEMGRHFLVVAAAEDELAQRIASEARAWRAERAQHYGRFIIEELIEPPQAQPQVAESPDRGLDAQSPSGTEQERLVRDEAAHARR
jgi:hypothetical protein